MHEALKVTKEEPTPFSPAMDRALNAFIKAMRNAAPDGRCEIVLLVMTPDPERGGTNIKQASTCGPNMAIVAMSSVIAAARNA